jgi:hypothetical protein
MPQTRVSCPNCRQPINAEIIQLIDLEADPSLKQKLLSGAINFLQCPACGYQGTLATYLVYHDPNKELLLTFVPAELGLPRNEQERLIGSLINQVVNRLPQEKRKGYLLNPQQTLTFQGMIERILEADGITREMIEAQQKKVLLIQQLLETPEPGLTALLKENDALVDAEFFGILRRLAEYAALGQDQQAVQQINALQKVILEKTSYGQELVKKNTEFSVAVRNLQALGDNVTREKVLDLVVKASSDTEVEAYVSLARPVMDYQFFQGLSDRIEKSRGDGRTRLVALREKLLSLTRLVDQEIETRHQNARKLVNQVLESDDLDQSLQEALPVIDEFFAEELLVALKEARSSGNLERIGKIQQLQKLLEEASAPPAEVAFIQDLLSTENDEEMQKMLENRSGEVTDEFLEILNGFSMQMQSGDDRALAQRMALLNRMATKFSMAKKLKN